MRQRYYFRPLIPLLLSLISGIFVGTRFPGHWIWGVLGVGAAGAFIGYFLICRKEIRLFPLIFFILLGYLSVQPWSAPRFPENHVVRFIGPQKRHLSGTVAGEIRRDEKRTRFVLTNLSIKDRRTNTETPPPVAGKLRVSCWGNPPAFQAGDRLSMTARIRPVNSFQNPGGFDYRRYLAFRGIWANAYTSERDLHVAPETGKSSFFYRIQGFRQTLSRFIDGRLPAYSAETRGILKALVLGLRSEISADLREAFSRAGVSHILAISGLHIGIVAGVAFWLWIRALSCFPALLRRAWTRKAAAVLSLIPVLGYGLLSGMAPSTQRAVIMVAIFLAALFFEKEHEPFNTLAMAALVILLVHPPALFSISFQLSFASVFSILFGMSKTRRWWERSHKTGKESLFSRMRRWLVSFLLVSGFAVLGTIPIVMLYFNRVALISLAANMAIVPLVGFLAVPGGLLGVCLYFVFPHGSAVCLEFSAVVVQKAIDAVHFFSRIPYASLDTFTPTGFEVVLYYAAMGLIFHGINREKGVPEPPSMVTAEDGFFRSVSRWVPVGLYRRRTWIGVFILVLAIAADAGYWLHHRLWHTDLRVSVIDVGAGNAVLAELPKGYNLLIDGGGFPDNTAFDVGANVVAPFLRRKKIHFLDAVVLSHPDSDHMNGLVHILRHFRVRALWTNGDREESESFHAFVRVVGEEQTPMPPYEKLPRTFRINGTDVDILYPPPGYRKFKERDRWRNTNNNSMVLRVRYKNTAFLFPGDIMAKAEDELIHIAGDTIQSTVMVAPHHGSKTSSTVAFVKTVKPRVVIVSAGNRGPHSKILQRYRRFGAGIYSTHVHGAVRVFADDSGIRILPTVKDARL